ncbi:MAG: septum formation initiator family protein [Bacteroidaceae bacterium]|nr:septum formation initiator family protein [Bacteroidaceae bacterium]
MSRIYSFWDFIRRHKFIVVAVFFTVMIGFVDEDSFYNRYLRNQEISALRAEMMRYQNRYENDTRALNDLQTSRDAVVRVAREQYFMKYPDEDVYVVMDAQKEPEKTETDETAVED